MLSRIPAVSSPGETLRSKRGNLGFTTLPETDRLPGSGIGDPRTPLRRSPGVTFRSADVLGPGDAISGGTGSQFFDSSAGCLMTDRRSEEDCCTTWLSSCARSDLLAVDSGLPNTILRPTVYAAAFIAWADRAASSPV